MTGIDDTLPAGFDASEGEATYRPVSAAAVFGLVLAAASPLALVTGWLTPLPAVAMVVCWIAARDVRASEGDKAGYGVAATGLAIAAVVAGATLTRAPTSQGLHEADAAAVVEPFLEHLAAGELTAAHELTVDQHLRRPSLEAAEVFYTSDEDGRERLAEFEANEVVARVVAAGSPPRLVRQTPVARASGGRLKTLWYYEVATPAGEPPIGLAIELRRASRRLGPSAWKVGDFRLVPLSDLDG